MLTLGPGSTTDRTELDEFEYLLLGEVVRVGGPSICITHILSTPVSL